MDSLAGLQRQQQAEAPPAEVNSVTQHTKVQKAAGALTVFNMYANVILSRLYEDVLNKMAVTVF